MPFNFFNNFTKSKPVRSPGDVPRSPIGTWKGNARSTVEYRNAIAAEMALQHPVVFRALNKIATSVQQVKWLAETDPDVIASERANPGTIKQLNALLEWPSDTLAPDQFRFWLAMTYAVYGRAPFKVGVNTAGGANGIYPLDARYLRAVSDSRGQIKSYDYGTSVSDSSKASFPTRRSVEKDGKFTGGFVHEIYTPNLAANAEFGKNINTLAAIGLPSEIITMLMKRAYDTASGHPNSKYIITSEKTLTAKQRDAIIETVENSAPDGEESGNILFLYNTTIDVEKLDNDLSDIHSKMPMDDMSRIIFGAFGIPIALVGLGAADGAKFAGNYIESRQAFWEDTIIPGYLTPIATGLTHALCPYGARIRFDLDSIDAIQDSRTSRAQRLEAVTFLTNDEKREISGWAPLTAEQRTQLAAEAALRKPAPVAKDIVTPEPAD